MYETIDFIYTHDILAENYKRDMIEENTILH
jgi:hypothetical protein